MIAGSPLWSSLRNPFCSCCETALLRKSAGWAVKIHYEERLPFTTRFTDGSKLLEKNSRFSNNSNPSRSSVTAFCFQNTVSHKTKRPPCPICQKVWVKEINRAIPVKPHLCRRIRSTGQKSKISQIENRPIRLPMNSQVEISLTLTKGRTVHYTQPCSHETNSN